MSKNLSKLLTQAAEIMAEEFIRSNPDSDDLYEEWEQYGYEELDDASETMQTVIENILKSRS